MAITDYIGIVKVDSQEYLTGSTLFGKCSTPAGTAAKEVVIESISSFTPTNGLTIHILFEHTNSASNPTIQFSSGSGAITYPLYAYGTNRVGTAVSTSWQDGAIVSLTFIDGTLENPSTDKRWILNSGTDTGADGMAAVTLANLQNADDLKAIEALTGTSGYLKKTATNTWALQTSTDASTTAAGITTVGAAGGAAAYEHGHGNITSDGKMSGSSVSGTVTNTHKFLREDGTWVVPAYTTDTHYNANLIVANANSDTANEAVTASTTGVYLNLVENNSVQNAHQLSGAGGITIGADSSGKITFTGKAGTVTSITPGNGLINGTSGSSQTAITESGTISIKEGGVTNAMLAGSISNDKLAGSISNDKLANSTIGIGTQSVTLGGTLSTSALLTELGLSSAMHYKGEVSAIPPASGTYEAGDVVTLDSTVKEYVYDGTSWRELGTEGSYKIVQTAVSDPTADTTTATTFIDTITQNTQGVITATKKTIPVISVASKTGAVTLDHTDVGLGNVTNHAQVTSLQWNSTSKAITYKVSEGSASAVVTFVAGSNISLTAAANELTITNDYTYTLPAASSTTRGGIKIGYTTNSTSRNYAVELSSEQAYVNVPWTDTKVTQTALAQDATGANKAYSLLFKNTGDDYATETAGAYFASTQNYRLTYNPSNGTLTAPKFSGNGSAITDLSTTAIKTALSTSTTDAIIFLHKSGDWKTLSLNSTSSATGALITGVSHSGGSLPTLTGGKTMVAAVSAGVLTLTAGTDASFTQGSFPTVSLTKADLALAIS